MDTEKQTVVAETEAEAQPSVEAPDAQETQDDVNWEDVFKEFNQTNEPQPATSSPEGQDQGNVLRAELDQLKAELAEVRGKSTKADINSLITEVGGETGLPGYAVRGFIDEQAENDPRIRDVFDNRDANPAAYKKVVAALTKQFASQNKAPIDPATTEDTAAVNAALRGSQTEASTSVPPKFSHLSDAEYRDKVKAEYGFDPGV